MFDLRHLTPVNGSYGCFHYQQTMFRKWALYVFLIVMSSPPSVAQTEEPSWMGLLQGQLDHDESCDLQYVTAVHEYHRSGKDIVEGRAHCADGRNFDFLRREGEAIFRLEQCDGHFCSNKQVKAGAPTD